MPPLFICGAGISDDAPARIAGTSRIVDTACSLLLPDSTRRERLYVGLVRRDIQPEILFEEASLLVGTTVLSVWDLLDVTNAEPNINHFIIVMLARQFNQPIITLNFDTLLEVAAQRCGFGEPMLYVPGVPDLENNLDALQGRIKACIIWKIHGCITMKSSLQNTMSKIARPNRSLLRALNHVLPEAEPWLIGYSGRDGDFFPEFAQMYRPFTDAGYQPRWIDPMFSKKEAPRRMGTAQLFDRAELIKAQRIGGDLPGLCDRIYPGWRRSLQTLCPSISVDYLLEQSRSGSSECGNTVRSAPNLERVLRETLHLEETQKQALLACLLLQAGHPQEAYEYACLHLEAFNSNLSKDLFYKVMLRFARMCDWNSKYRRFLEVSEITSNPADIDARDHNLCRIASVCLRTRAASMLLGPTMTWPDSQCSFRAPLGARVRLYARCAVTSMKIRFWLGRFRPTPWWRLFHPFVPGDAASAEEVSAWQFYLDHRQVFLNYLLAFLARATLIQDPATTGAGLASWISRKLSRIALDRVSNLVRRAGAPYTQADMYLFRARMD